MYTYMLSKCIVMSNIIISWKYAFKCKVAYIFGFMNRVSFGQLHCYGMADVGLSLDDIIKKSKSSGMRSRGGG